MAEEKIDVTKIGKRDLTKIIASSRDAAKALNELIEHLENNGISTRQYRAAKTAIIKMLKNDGFLDEFKRRCL